MEMAWLYATQTTQQHWLSSPKLEPPRSKNTQWRKLIRTLIGLDPHAYNLKGQLRTEETGELLLMAYDPGEIKGPTSKIHGSFSVRFGERCEGTSNVKRLMKVGDKHSRNLHNLKFSVKSLPFSFFICALNISFAQKLPGEAKLAQSCQNRKKLLRKPKVVQNCRAQTDRPRSNLQLYYFTFRQYMKMTRILPLLAIYSQYGPIMKACGKETFFCQNCIRKGKGLDLGWGLYEEKFEE